jgi:hypothetical protein
LNRTGDGACEHIPGVEPFKSFKERQVAIENRAPWFVKPVRCVAHPEIPLDQLEFRTNPAVPEVAINVVFCILLELNGDHPVPGTRVIQPPKMDAWVIAPGSTSDAVTAADVITGNNLHHGLERSKWAEARSGQVETDVSINGGLG